MLNKRKINNYPENYPEDDLENDCDETEEWDDPNTYARCSDWEDEPEHCDCCADDECLMNKS